MAKEAGANKVYFASAAPPVKYQNLYGIDMPATKELVASKKTDEEICAEIGADWLIYQDLSGLIASVQEGNPDIKEFECSVFTGEYITPLGENYLKDLEISRQDEVKAQREKAKA
jgi:amidophosphoribosyltransferase